MNVSLLEAAYFLAGLGTAAWVMANATPKTGRAETVLWLVTMFGVAALWPIVLVVAFLSDEGGDD